MKDNTVKCPNCREVFKVDDSVYTDIVKQVRDQQFDAELNNRLLAAEKEKQSAIALTETRIKISFQDLLNKKDKEISALAFKSKAELVDEVSKKEKQLQELQSKIDRAETENKFELQHAVNGLEKEKN